MFEKEIYYRKVFSRKIYPYAKMSSFSYFAEYDKDIKEDK
jgi:hypothetical protein